MGRAVTEAPVPQEDGVCVGGGGARQATPPFPCPLPAKGGFQESPAQLPVSTSTIHGGGLNPARSPGRFWRQTSALASWAVEGPWREHLPEALSVHSHPAWVWGTVEQLTCA